MEFNAEEALRYLGIQNAPDDLRRLTEEVAAMLTASISPRYIYKIFPLLPDHEDFLLSGTQVRLSGRSSSTMLADCDEVVLLACTLGTQFDELLRREQARDMGRAAILDACGGAWVEAGCDEAEREIQSRLPGRHLTDRFSPGYGDLSLAVQPDISDALDMERRIGVHVTKSLMMNPVKSVTAIIGVSNRPQMARIRGCEYCSMRENCTLKKGGNHCGISF